MLTAGLIWFHMVVIEVHFFFLKYLKNVREQHLILVMVVWKCRVNIFSMENTARKDAFCRFWSSRQIPTIQSPVLRGKAARGTTNTPNTYWRLCSLGMRHRVFNPIFNYYLSFQEENPKDLICWGLLKIANSVRWLRVNRGMQNLPSPHFGTGKCLNCVHVCHSQTLAIPEVTLPTCLCNIEQLSGSQITTGKSYCSPWT